MPRVRLSPTGLARWYQLGCPAAWDFSRLWTPVKENIYFELGNLVHDLLAGAITPGQVEDRTALAIFRKLVELKSALGLTALLDPQGRPLAERKHEWAIAPGIVFVCKTDLIASLPDGEPVVVDWKATLGYGWKRILAEKGELVAPQSLAFQSPGYLVPRPAKILKEYGLSEWPKRMYYLVGPARGPAQVEQYAATPKDLANFRTALRQAAQAILAGNFPKVYGKHCHDCDYKSICFQTPGWEADYHAYRPGGDAPPAVDL